MNNISVSNKNINFQAKFLAKTQVYKKIENSQKKLLPQEVNLLELNMNNANDLQALDYIKQNWINSEYVGIICSPSNDTRRKLHVLTLQTANFDKLENDKILAIHDILVDGEFSRWRFLQGRPDIVYNASREIIGVGRAVLESTKNLLKDQGVKKIDTYVERAKQPFFKKVFPEFKNKICTQESYTNLELNF